MSIKSRNEVPVSDTWDLGKMFTSEKAWEEKTSSISVALKRFGRFQGTLGTSAKTLQECLEETLSIRRDFEMVYNYAHLHADEDTGNAHYQGLMQKGLSLYSEIATATAFLRPEILAIDDNKMAEFLKYPGLKPYLRVIEEIVRYKPHTLNTSEEGLLALATEVLMSPQGIFSQLNNADFNFGTIIEDGVEKPLTHSTYTLILKSQNRDVRKEAFTKHFAVYEAHKNSLAAVLTASIRGDVFNARARKYPSALEASLFPDQVERKVYENLISTVSANTNVLSRYYNLKAKVLKLPKLQSYDVLVSPVKDVKFKHTFEQAAEVILESLKPLGSEYTETLRKGFLQDRWVDRYENKGKRSGAYSSGCYDSPPYMLMNFKEDAIDDVFTLAHEAGHSMHSYFSGKNQPYQDHEYPIITAEVASTFNEQLLFAHFDKIITDPQQKLFLLNHHLEEINGTLFRQVMFAEFEMESHNRIERGEPLTVETYRHLWSNLMQKYYGGAVDITPGADLGCFRIPHFYSAFYVYKYATGIAAAIMLADSVMSGGTKERERYLSFLKSGGSKPPPETLKLAGVDLTKPEPINRAIELFGNLVDSLEKQLKN